MSENQNNPAVELTAEEEQQKRSEILQIRRDKLSALQEEGKDPFQITTYARTRLWKSLTRWRAGPFRSLGGS